ncbi:hypothetical protein [Qipengyuania gaetbuli]|uniref:hypothetical protein n=1 Tax=Qipengyuania gaetbuli TaxID=266952 RepID=UPI001CD793A7|nr:hypothetical protein [Qipengyuania gaetbuli]MCA0908928.1 hypothetical protein [Qipengyuania gaetbuli]
MIVTRVFLLGALVLASGAAVASFDERAAAFGMSVLPEEYAIGSKRLQVAAIAHAEDGNIEDAKASARRAIVRSPLDQGPLSTLGAIQFDNGEAEAAQKSFRAAGALGWRDLATQAYIVEQATQARDAVVLAQRIDAILRLGTPYERVANLVLTAESYDSEYAAMPSRLASSPPWLSNYIVDAGGLSGPALERRVKMLRAGRDQGMPLNCRPVGWASQKMIESGNMARAIDTWQQLGCGEISPSNLGRIAGGFEEQVRGQETTTLLQWNLEQSGDIQAAIETAPHQMGGKALHVIDNAPGEKLAAMRAIRLGSGRHILQWQDHSPAQGSDYAVEVDCVHSGRKLSQRSMFEADSGSETGKRELTFEVDGEACDGQRIRIFSIGSGQRADFWLDAFIVRTARRTR